MAVEYLTTGIKAFLTIFKYVPHLFGVTINYWRRPKFKFGVSYAHIDFTKNDGNKLSPLFPSIRLQNESSKDFTLDLEKFSVNGTSLIYIVQENRYFSRTLDQNPPENKLTTKNVLINTIRENWTSSKFIKVPAHEYLEFPMYPKKMGDSMYFNALPEAKVFLPKRKIVIVLTANSNEYHYAINRIEFLKIIINCLTNEHTC